MADSDKPLKQQYHEMAEALKADGMKNADAVKEVARRLGKQENAVRAGIHQYKTQLAGGIATVKRSRRRAAATVEDYMASARQALQAASELIDREVAQAKAELDAAQTRYDEAVAAVKDRKADIEAKLKAVT